MSTTESDRREDERPPPPPIERESMSLEHVAFFLLGVLAALLALAQLVGF